MRRLAAIFSKRDKHPPPPLLTDNAHSSASSSSGSASLYLPTPDDEHHPIEIVGPHTKKNWKSWLKPSKSQKFPQQRLWHNPIPDWTHELNDTKPSPPADQQARPTVEDVQNAFTVIIKNSLNPYPALPSPFAYRPNSSARFPRSMNISNAFRRPNTLASTMFKKRLLNRFQSDRRPLTQAELQSISSFVSHKTLPELVMTEYQSPDLVDEPAPSQTTVFTFSSPGVARWILRPCFEDRCDVFLPEGDGSVSRHPVVGTAFAVAALEYSVTLEAMIESDLSESEPEISPLVIEVPSPSASDFIPTSSSSGYTRNSPYIAVPSPLRNDHNSPSVVDPMQSAPSTITSPIPSPTAPEPLVKRGVRFAEDDKDDIIPLGYVMRMKQKREEKAKFLRAERERRLLQEERKQIEEERRKRDLERAEWEKERNAWEKEKRAMEEEKQHRKYAEEVLAARLRRESHRAGGVPALKGSDTDTQGYLGSAGLHYPASVTASASERNRPSPSRRHSRPIYGDDRIPPTYTPRREASEPSLPTITKTSPNDPNVAATYSRRHASNSNSNSPNSSRPDSIESSSPLPGTRSPSIHSSSSEDVKAAVARTKRNSVVAPASRNSSNTSFTGVTPYSIRSGSSPSLSNMTIGAGVVPPVPPLPTQMQMMPVPAFVMDMPLLPPTPPFMMQQYPRRQGSPGRSSRNSSKVRFSGSRNSSQERVNAINGSGSGSTDGSSGNGHTPRSSSLPRPEYRHLSPPSPRSSPQTPSLHGSQGEELSSRRASMPTQYPHHYMQPQRQSSHNERRASNPAHLQAQPQSTSRGMSAQHLQPPSPWTGLPTQNGELPNANGTMAARQSSLRNGTSKRRTMIV